MIIFDPLNHMARLYGYLKVYEAAKKCIAVLS